MSGGLSLAGWVALRPVRIAVVGRQRRKIMEAYRVTLHEEPGDEFVMAFDCIADDADHAAEQAENAYPGCEVINATPGVADVRNIAERTSRNREDNDFGMLQCPVWAVEEYMGRGKRKYGSRPIYIPVVFFFTAEEAGNHLRANAHNLHKKARVYGYPAIGALKAILDSHTEGDRS
jgi:hypothetical protein